jgi:hypothetical protein
MILRFLNVQGIAGLAVGLALAVLLVVQKGETRHWKKQSASFEQLYATERAALAGTVANYRAAAETARSADKANAARVAADQRAINERTASDYETRLAAARARANRLQFAAKGSADPGPRGGAPMPAVPTPPGRTAEGADQGRLSDADALIATEQAIQLDELIKWVRQQAEVDAKVDKGPASVAIPPGN